MQSQRNEWAAKLGLKTFEAFHKIHRLTSVPRYTQTVPVSRVCVLPASVFGAHVGGRLVDPASYSTERKIGISDTRPRDRSEIKKL
jgi:hypothetical protein